MRKVILAFAAFVGVLAVNAGTAHAREYAYCLKEGWEPGPGTCYYTSYAQCMASASGRNAYCDVNPRVAFGQQYGEPRRKRRPANTY